MGDVSTFLESIVLLLLDPLAPSTSPLISPWPLEAEFSELGVVMLRGVVSSRWLELAVDEPADASSPLGTAGKLGKLPELAEETDDCVATSDSPLVALAGVLELEAGELDSLDELGNSLDALEVSVCSLPDELLPPELGVVGAIADGSVVSLSSTSESGSVVVSAPESVEGEPELEPPAVVEAVVLVCEPPISVVLAAVVLSVSPLSVLVVKLGVVLVPF